MSSPPTPARQREGCLITTTATDDEVWIPLTAAEGWLIVTRDSAIQRRGAERNAVRDSRARMVALAGGEAQSTWTQLEPFMTRWREIDARTKREGPFMYSVSRRGRLRAIP